MKPCHEGEQFQLRKGKGKLANQRGVAPGMFGWIPHRSALFSMSCFVRTEAVLMYLRTFSYRLPTALLSLELEEALTKHLYLQVGSTCLTRWEKTGLHQRFKLLELPARMIHKRTKANLFSNIAVSHGWSKDTSKSNFVEIQPTMNGTKTWGERIQNRFEVVSSFFNLKVWQ